ncbi:MAG: hypothetical protein U0269_36375 [Polyangiales bacterium]
MTYALHRRTWWLIAASAALVGCPAPPPPTDADAGADAAQDTRGDSASAEGSIDSAVEDVVADSSDASADAGDAASETGADGAAPLGRDAPTNGAAIALSQDDRVLVAANRSAGSVSVFTVRGGTPAALERTAELSTGAGSEPWAVVLDNAGDRAFVVLRGEQRVVRIDNVRTAPVIAAQRGTTGSEPTAIAIAPNGSKLFVANWVDGTVTVLSTADLSRVATVDLNASLAASGMLGTVTARPALAHPRALVVTNDGDADDADETVYVTEFFGQRRTAGVPNDGTTEYDLDHQGVIYRFNAGTGAVAPLVTIAPVTDTGFVASNNEATGCWPNQLANLAINSGRLYVSAVCTSPRGPVNVVVPAAPADGGVAPAPDVRNVKTEVHAAVFVVDLATQAEIPSQGALLTKQFQSLYDGPMPSMPTTPDDGSRRIPLLPSGLAFVPGSNVLYVSGYGSDAVFRVRYNVNGTLAEVGSSTSPFINLAPAGSANIGRLPIGVAIANTASLSNAAFVLNEHTRNVSVINLATQSVASATTSAAMPAAGSSEEQINDGRRFFVTGTGRWSLRGQAWNSCESCHVDGLSDNVTWFFARGPRQSTSLDGSYGPDGSQRIFNWTAIFDETQDLEANTRANSGGVGGLVHAVSAPATNGDRIIIDGTAPTGAQIATAAPQAGLSGSASELINAGVSAAGGGTVRAAIDDWNRIRAYVLQIRAPRAPSNLDAADVTAGRQLFVDNNCAGCHGGSLWTVSRRFYTPGETNNHPTTGRLRSTDFSKPMGFPMGLAPLVDLGPARLRYNGSDSANFDSIQCVLRAVGTFPSALDADRRGVSATDVHVREVRGNMSTAAQGAEGFNVPALIGMSMGAPYFHAGNARTLEEVFSTVFDRHAQAFSSNFLTGMNRAVSVRQLVAFINSIDDSTSPVAARGALSFEPDLCPLMF